MKGKTLRRLFAWLLSAMLLATCVPTAFAEDALPVHEATPSEPVKEETTQEEDETPTDGTACEHVASPVPRTDWVPVGEYMRTPETHAVAKAAVKVTVCALCGAELNREPMGGESEPRPEAHTFVDGVCTVCGYALPAGAAESAGNDEVNEDGESDGTGESNRTGEPSETVEPNENGEADESDEDDETGEETPCRHEAAAEAQMEWAATGGYRIGSDTHAAVTAEYSVTVCALCGAELFREPTGERAVAEEEPHVFGEGNVCDVCGSAKLIPPANPQDGQGAEPVAAENGQSAADGAMPLSTGDCPHAKKYLVYDDVRHNEKYTQNNDGETHHAEYDRYESYNCENCGQTVEEFKEKVSKDEPCAFYCPGSGSLVLCQYCWQEKTCTHDEKELISSDSCRIINYTPNDDGKTHRTISDQYEDYRCKNCGSLVSVYKGRVEEDHPCTFYCPNSDSLVKCQYCGREKTCEHDEKELLNADKRTIISCTPNDGGETHHIVYDWSEEYFCKNCESHISVFKERVETDEPCTYYCPNLDSLVMCQYCGREKTCEHDEKEMLNSDARSIISYEQNDDGKTHHVVYDRYEYSHCKNCGSYLRIFKERAETDEPCWFYCPNSDSLVICQYCGREKTCEHEWEERRSDEMQGDPVPNGNGTHTQEYVPRYYRFCGICGTSVTQRYGDPYTELEECSYYKNDGKCARCHAPAACAHELTRTYTYEDQITNYVPNGDGTHTYTYTQCTVEQCIRCGKYVSAIREEPGMTETKTCRFDDSGVCPNCGYKNTCTHPDPTKLTSKLFLVSSKPDMCTPNADGLTHTETATYVKRQFCRICRTYIDGEETERVYTYLDRHTFDENGVCISCKYKRECTHPNAYDRIDEWMSKDSVIARDANGHTVERWLYKTRYCPDCGVRLETYQLTGEKTTYVEDHSFDENGQCFTCGYVIVCAHQHTYESYATWEIASITQADALYHRVLYDHRIGVHCADCGASLGTETVRTGVSALERHEFWQGRCEECGYELACAHTRTKIERELVGEYQITARYENAHTAKYQVEETTRCADCGELLGVKREPAQEFAVAHDWWNQGSYRACAVCGYREAFDKTACLHAHTTSENEIEAVTPQADGHLVTYSEMSQYAWCNDCGTYLVKQNTGKNGTVLEPHEFENGKCTVCGYVNTCGHDSEKGVYTEYRLARNVRDNGDGTHTMVADVWTHTYCKQCGEDQSVELARNQTVRTAHDVQNGACIYCYAKAQQTPSALPQSGSDDDGGGSSGGRRTGGTTTVQPTQPLTPQAPVAATQELVMSVNSIALQLTVSPSATIEIVGAEEIMTDAEYQRFDRLNLSEQIMVMLSVAGVTEDITSALPPSAMLLTAGAQTLIAEITGRIETGGAAPFQFEIGDVTVNGVPCKCVTITFEVTMDGVKMRTTRSFYFDPMLGEWVAMDALAVV